MKIINRGQLLEAPAGTVYRRYIPDIMNEVIRPNGQIMIDPDWSPFDE